MAHRPQNYARYPQINSVVAGTTRSFQVRTRHLCEQENNPFEFTAPWTPVYKMDKSTQELPRHPLGAGLGLGSWDKLAVSGVNK